MRLGDDFAVFEVQGPSFGKQRAQTRQPASRFGGTVGDVSRLHHEASLRW
ncbi:hypothetical protein BMULJ_04201 [Burkholderia multivorans ATCC 17616]|uniref:Uncharacterized protein n=1 Tax=Burkholderia multivorans (strain ATCC 17616 / 249) TaxID=395019 RepID=A0A0H3KR49_BURM1|nr:hypothetical protein BMULJ_04201 [Burkholderia multivorans ATCC 17616]